jgi:hypothetical protein
MMNSQREIDHKDTKTRRFSLGVLGGFLSGGEALRN